MKKVFASKKLSCPRCDGELEYFEGYENVIEESYARIESRYRCPACGRYYRIISHYAITEHEYFEE